MFKNNTKIFIDLHMHSTHSDGKLTPEELVDLAIEKQISAIAITDHEIISGNIKAQEYARSKNIEIVSGIEIGADDANLNLFDIHIVGLFVDSKNKELNDLINHCLKAREIQKKKIIEKLNELGYEITFKELQNEAGNLNYGRPHIARILMKKYPNKFKDNNEIYDKLLANPNTAYIRQEKKTIKEVIDIIHNANGIAILAHPGFYKNKKEVILKFLELNGDGIEVNYAYENDMSKEKAQKTRNEIKVIIKNKNIIISGGTDFHDPKIHCEIGSFGIEKQEFELMKNYIKKL